MKCFQQVNGGGAVERPHIRTGGVGSDGMLGHLAAREVVRLESELRQDLFVRSALVLLEPLLRRL